MKFTRSLALVVVAVASTAAVDAQRKLAFAPDYTGPPCGDMLCPDNYAPVCGSDGVTYSNECKLGITSCNQPEKNITLVGEGACTPASSATPSPKSSSDNDACPDACLDVYEPVTDENGKEYSNECYMKMAKCQVTSDNGISTLDAERKLAFAPDYTGPPCGDMLCPDNYAPVCGSDGVTYSNECKLGITSCNQPEKNITLVGEGACTPASSATPSPKSSSDNDACPDACLDVYEPVTDENGKEYSNECYMKMAKCQVTSDNGISTLDAERKLAFAPDYTGPPCGDMLCPDNYAPVCGSDGVTYSNECKLGITSCNQPEKNITLVGEGACSSQVQQEHQQEQPSKCV